jgi:3-hydroxyisobutyrate dehydrogenase-like beta-hydroxyacid dehydrogenase
VVTCVASRGPATQARAQEAGIELLPGLDDVVRQAGLVLSLVTPFGAAPLAGDLAAALGRTGARPLFVDGNSIGPGTAGDIAAVIEAAGGIFVDGCIIGAAANLDRANFYLSGAQAEQAGAVLQAAVQTHIIGDRAGQASGFKILYAGLTKGMSALGYELLSGAQSLGLTDQLLTKYRSDHAGVAAFFERTLPELPPRATRRSQEMNELAATLEGLGLTAHVAHAAEQVLADIGSRYSGDGKAAWQELMRPLVREKAPA